ncbi:unnamed protein product [Bursaphelenchus xylophilus]|uniref:(pine wood nematode) hypothetical protein n=1 Tax=Bursaphelenchus xylophilus TaxID=6326 RepID=A0A1I7RSR6_BURXY|nr:unnamed protein product [Bursaphelenchus xylophilus]CAG9122826.1 unnamed protein product [Bursaphelenchus xylophilus]
MRLASLLLTIAATAELMLEGLAMRRRHQRDLNSILEDVLPLPNEPVQQTSPDYFKEYLSRGMFQCTSQYVETITKLHEFIKKAHEEYKRCERRKGLTPKSEQNPFESLNKFIGQWQMEEEAEKAALGEAHDRSPSSKDQTVF